jgi:hypothetical protein
VARSRKPVDEAYRRLKEAGRVVVPNHKRAAALGATVDCLRRRAQADGHVLRSRRLPGIPPMYEVVVTPVSSTRR